MLRLAVIDNDPTSARRVALEAALRRSDWVEVIAEEKPPSRPKAARLDAILLDPAAVGTDFWSYLEEICRELPDLSVLVLAGKSDVASRIRALRLGADDWITKPSSASEILARVEASRRPRRVKSPALEAPVSAGDLEIRPAGVDAWTAAGPIGLTPREFELLQFLVREEGRVLTRKTIYRRVWGYTILVGDRSIYTYIRKLRIKLRAASPGWDYIHTHPGIGYRFEPRLTAVPLGRIEIPALSAVTL